MHRKEGATFLACFKSTALKRLSVFNECCDHVYVHSIEIISTLNLKYCFSIFVYKLNDGWWNRIFKLYPQNTCCYNKKKALERHKKGVEK